MARISFNVFVFYLFIPVKLINHTKQKQQKHFVQVSLAENVHARLSSYIACCMPEVLFVSLV